MGFFDFLKGKSAPPPKGGGGGGSKRPPGDKRVAGLARVVADKRAQTYDRMEALQSLAEMRSPEAAIAVLPRFRFTIDPSITDQEEKDVAFAGATSAGTEIVPAIVEYCEQAETKGWPITWPLKILRAVLDDEGYQKELLDLLAGFDTEYARNIEPKLQVILALEDEVHEDVRLALEPFLEDVNETIRFHAVENTFRQNNVASLAPLLRLLVTEESVRVCNKVAEGLAFRGWEIPEDQRADVQKALSDSPSYRLAGGKIQKTGVDY